MSSSSYRPRRTRIYGANYDIGESYYKKQLESLDNKHSVGSTSSSSRLADSYLSSDLTAREDRLTPKVSFLHDNEDDDFYSKYPATRALNSRALATLEDDDEAFGSNFRSYGSKLDTTDGYRLGESLKKDTASILKKSYDIIKERTPVRNELENGYESIKKDIFKKTSFGLAAKDRTPFLNELEDQAYDGGFTSSRRLKIRSEIVENSAASEAATSRARATKARLADLEADMLSISEKQSKREERKHHLKNLLSESDLL